MQANLLPPPYGLSDNEFSLLDQTDLVFIDPVSTGYSRPVEGQKARDFHGFKKDIESVGRFHPAVYHPLRALVLTQIPGGRKLWHHTFRRALRLSPGTPRSISERHHAYLSGPGFQHTGIRTRQ